MRIVDHIRVSARILFYVTALSFLHIIDVSEIVRNIFATFLHRRQVYFTNCIFITLNYPFGVYLRKPFSASFDFFSVLNSPPYCFSLQIINVFFYSSLHFLSLFLEIFLSASYAMRTPLLLFKADPATTTTTSPSTSRSTVHIFPDLSSHSGTRGAVEFMVTTHVEAANEQAAKESTQD